MALSFFSRVSSASASELQIKTQTLKKMLGLEEHVQGRKCRKGKLLLIDPKGDGNAGLQAICPSQEKVQKNPQGFRQTPQEMVVGGGGLLLIFVCFCFCF